MRFSAFFQVSPVMAPPEKNKHNVERVLCLLVASRLWSIFSDTGQFIEAISNGVALPSQNMLHGLDAAGMHCSILSRLYDLYGGEVLASLYVLFYTPLEKIWWSLLNV
jgi:hypothetical protein